MRGVGVPPGALLARTGTSQTRRGPDARSVLAMGAGAGLPLQRVLGWVRVQGRSQGQVTHAGSSG